MNSPLKWHGGKGPLASKIVAMMPPHIHYVEPFAGGLSVMLAKNPEGVSEVANDIHGDLVNFWRVLAHPEWFEMFYRASLATPFSQPHWDASHKRTLIAAPDWLRALKFFVHVRQSMAGRGDAFAPLSRTRTRRGMNEQASAWLSAVEGLPEVHARLSRVVILNRPALEVIRSQDGPDTLMYLDPPYLAETRSVPDVYAHEMSEADHVALLDVIRQCVGKVMLSGYPSLLYDEALAGWHRVVFDVANHAASGDVKARKQEVVWCNFEPKQGA
jgi:DNA adenine methylase